MPTDLAPSEDHFPGLQMVIFLQCPHMAGEVEVGEREKENTLLSFSFASNTIMRTALMPSFKPNTFQRSSIHIPSHWGSGVQHMNWGLVT